MPDEVKNREDEFREYKREKRLRYLYTETALGWFLRRTILILFEGQDIVYLMNDRWRWRGNCRGYEITSGGTPCSINVFVLWGKLSEDVVFGNDIV